MLAVALVFLAGCNDNEGAKVADAGKSLFTPPDTLTGPPSKPDTSTAQPSKPDVTVAAPSEAEIFAAVAPQDKVFEDTNKYDTTISGAIELSKVTEETSVKRHTLKIDGVDVPYTARAGHLIAYATDSSGRTAVKLADGGTLPGKTPQAAIFYTAYTRDGLPKDKRPITFLWNGGPGSASIWLHMGSWGPMRIKSDAPSIPEQYYQKQPETLPFVENDISLLDQSDIVFVDPPGTGFSTAIAPLANGDLWGTSIDAEVVANFITSYINANNRQSSPKYLYGESYGGIRTPIVANLLEQAGTSNYVPDPSGKPPQVLTGFILNSPLVNYGTNCDMTQLTGVAGSCAGYIPSYAMAADFFKKSTLRGNKTQEAYLEDLRSFTRNSFMKENQTPQEKADLIRKLSSYTGLSESLWTRFPNMGPDTVRANLVSGFQLGRYDARMKLPNSSSYEADAYIDTAFLSRFKTYLPDFVNYKNLPTGESAEANTDYQPMNYGPLSWKTFFSGETNWAWKRTGSTIDYPESVTDIQAVLTANPNSKILVLHGYEDVATPGFQTELDLKSANLLDRVPVKWFEGGHMTYNTESSRAPLKRTIDQFYGTPAVDFLGLSATNQALRLSAGSQASAIQMVQ
ncbi:hypothetical protein ACETRX_36295 [Labrys portucalensis]|uniref:Peptidase n=1 Tax=Labrys neptuniae TaxID=376174 RepID=A0ABV6ZSI2_9HYPH